MEYVYNDRLDYKKWKSSKEAVVGILAGTPRYYQEALRQYWNDPELELGCIITYVNQNNGGQYFVFGYKRSQTQA